MPVRWLQIDGALENPPYYIDLSQDLCYYAREYVSGGGWQASATNQLITNFKKLPDRRGTPEWFYKEQAIAQFASELAGVIPSNCNLGYIPCSKRKDHPEYDDRLETTLRQLKTLRTDLTLVEPLAMRESMEAYHSSGQRRHPDQIYEKLEWQGLPPGLSHVILIDDVITSGAHFKACKRMIGERQSDVDVIGVFWARAITRDEAGPH